MNAAPVSPALTPRMASIIGQGEGRAAEGRVIPTGNNIPAPITGAPRGKATSPLIWNMCDTLTSFFTGLQIKICCRIWETADL